MAHVLETLIALLIQLFLLTLGARWLSPLLTRASTTPPHLTNIHHPLYAAQLVFACTFSTAGSLFLLVLGEILHLFSKGARKYYWQSNLAVLLMLVLIVIPWLQVYTFLRKTRGWRWRTSVYTTTAAWACYLYLFSATFSSQYWEQVSLDWLEFGIIRVGILGITLTSMLSGFGMVDTPFSTWKALTLRVKDADYRAAQLAYQRTLSTINKKKSILAQAQPEQAQSTSFLNRMIANFRPSEQQMLQMEIDQLTILSTSMKSDLDELERYWLFHRHSKTFRGKCRTLLDIGISVYCVYKLCMTAWNVLVGRMGNGDPVTNLLSWMMARAGNNVHMDPNFWSQQLSFWFAGIIVSRTMRGFFQLVTKIIGHFLSTMAIDDSQILLMMANLMGMYFLSSVVMMQLSLPVDYRYLLASSLEHVEFTFFQHWADLIVFIASVCTIVVLYAVKQTKDISGLAKDYADINLDALESGP